MRMLCDMFKMFAEHKEKIALELVTEFKLREKDKFTEKV